MSRLRCALAPGGWPLRRSHTAIVFTVTAASLVVIAVGPVGCQIAEIPKPTS